MPPAQASYSVSVPHSSTHVADRLLKAISQKRAPVCVGLDPVLDRIPGALLKADETFLDQNVLAARGLYEFCKEVLGAITAHVPCVKIQSACFERYGESGVSMIRRLIARAHRLGLEVILDAKRGDIGISAEHYAAAAFEPGGDSAGGSAADWLTINSYLGEDGITPFLRQGYGAFALVRTSNPGGDSIQNLQLKDGRSVSYAVGDLIARIGSQHVGTHGYSSLGAVVGATKREDAAKLRQIMPQQMFLVPGYGAQGAGLEDVLPCFKPDGTGAIVTASRSVIYAFKQDDPHWINSVADAAAKFADDIGRAVGVR